MEAPTGDALTKGDKPWGLNCTSLLGDHSSASRRGRTSRSLRCRGESEGRPPRQRASSPCRLRWTGLKRRRSSAMSGGGAATVRDRGEARQGTQWRNSGGGGHENVRPRSPCRRRVGHQPHAGFVGHCFAAPRHYRAGAADPASARRVVAVS
jgi:hypothetical protein